MSAQERVAENQPHHPHSSSIPIWAGRSLTSRQVALLALVLSVLVMIAHRPLIRSAGGDTAVYDYVAQSILRGQVPYRDVVDIKFPGAAHLSALAMFVFKPFRIRDLIAVRILNVILVALLEMIIFLVGLAYLGRIDAAVIGLLFPLMSPRFLDWMVGGTEPKLPLMVFGMLTLLLIAWDRPFWAGFSSMLACLCWQPGLMFTGVAVLIFSRYLTSWRDLRALKALAGAAIPLAATFGYFYSRGALGDLWAWTITYNYSVFGPMAERSVFGSLDHLYRVTSRVLDGNNLIVIASIIGFAIMLVERVAMKFKQGDSNRSTELFKDAIVFPPLIYFAFCLINFQAGPDLIPFIPFVGIFAAKAIIELCSQLQRIKKDPVFRDVVIPRLVIVVMVLTVLVRAVTFKPDGGTIAEQDKSFKIISENLGPNDQIYTHGTTELLVLFDKPNLSPYVFLDYGADDFAASRRGIDFNQIIEEMDAKSPKIIALSRMKVVTHRNDFKNWVDQKYTPLEVPGYDGIYIRNSK
jgi:hypothetical protein